MERCYWTTMRLGTYSLVEWMASNYINVFNWNCFIWLKTWKSFHCEPKINSPNQPTVHVLLFYQRQKIIAVRMWQWVSVSLFICSDLVPLTREQSSCLMWCHIDNGGMKKAAVPQRREGEEGEGREGWAPPFLTWNEALWWNWANIWKLLISKLLQTVNLLYHFPLRPNTRKKNG